jgi:mono/diheme cytochrome c family protein
LSAFDDVSARYGLEGRPVRSLAMLDGQRVAFLLDHEVAVADGARVTRYGPVPWTSLAGGAGAGVGVVEDAVVVFDASTLAMHTYALPGVKAAAIGADGRLYASTARAIYAATPSGDLALVYDAGHASIHGLVAAGQHVWFADGSELGLVRDAGVAETTGTHVAPNAVVTASPTGDVWILSGGALQRYAVAETSASPAWSTTLAPIFARVCASCHQPSGVAGVDLSTAAAWDDERDAIRDRVVISKTMPPEDHPLSNADRAAIQAWTEGPGPAQR